MDVVNNIDNDNIECDNNANPHQKAIHTD